METAIAAGADWLFGALGIGLPAAVRRAVFALAVLLLAAAACLLAVRVARVAVRQTRLARLDARYPGILPHIPRTCRVKADRRGAQNSYELRFPFWSHATNSGAQDRRYSQNAVVWPPCVVHVDGCRLICPDPKATLGIVTRLRSLGADIPPCDLEREKGRALVAEARRLNDLDTVESIVRTFSDRPERFEAYCADLFRRLGYGARTTPATNDGGYDVELFGNGVYGLVECKCFDPAHKVGRPLVQKLVGANQVVGANLLMFVTTSSFSRDALDYAAQTGVECVDGNGLLALRNRALGARPARVGFDDVDWQLTLDDIAPYYPPDLVHGG